METQVTEIKYKQNKKTPPTQTKKPTTTKKAPKQQKNPPNKKAINFCTVTVAVFQLTNETDGQVQHVYSSFN